MPTETNDRQAAPPARERDLLRDLAKRYLDICRRPVQDERRRLWRLKNSLQPVRPLIYVRAFAWEEMPEAALQCSDPFLRGFEAFFRQYLLHDTFNDDSIYEPWVTLQASHRCAGWGVAGERQHSDDPRGSWKLRYPIQELDDVGKLRPPRHDIDEAATARNLARLSDVLGDVITINLDRGPAYRTWSADLSTDLGYLRGIENIMLDMIDHPEWLHRLLAFMRDGVLRAHDQAEAAGDWGLCDHYNQAMAYASELKDPAPNARGVRRGELWAFVAAQEMTLISPAMHDEFVLAYQAPILDKFALVAYGCCEDLTHKIDILRRRLPRLRRIAVAPAANVARCAEQIGKDFVLSYRPSPADMVSYGFDPERVRSILRRDFAACRGCHFDVTLKDVETVQGDRERIGKWVRIVRELIEE